MKKTITIYRLSKILDCHHKTAELKYNNSQLLTIHDIVSLDKYFLNNTKENWPKNWKCSISTTSAIINFINQL